MAKYELSLQTDFDEFVRSIKEGIEQRSSTVSLEEESTLSVENIRIHVVAYERYAFVGGNRSSLNVTFVGADGTVHLIATATGGSSARFIKINTWSESSFLDTLIFAANDYMRDNDLEPLFVRSSEDELDE